MTYPCTFYKKPLGEQIIVEVKNIYPEDEEFLKQHDIVVSMEDLEGPVVYGRFPHQDEEEEQIVLGHGLSCEETFKALVDLLKGQNDS